MSGCPRLVLGSREKGLCRLSSEPPKHYPLNPRILRPGGVGSSCVPVPRSLWLRGHTRCRWIRRVSLLRCPLGDA